MYSSLPDMKELTRLKMAHRNKADAMGTLTLYRYSSLPDMNEPMRVKMTHRNKPDAIDAHLIFISP